MSTIYNKNFSNIKTNGKMKKLQRNIEIRLGGFYSCMVLFIANMFWLTT